MRAPNPDRVYAVIAEILSARYEANIRISTSPLHNRGILLASISADTQKITQNK